MKNSISDKLFLHSIIAIYLLRYNHELLSLYQLSLPPVSVESQITYKAIIIHDDINVEILNNKYKIIIYVHNNYFPLQHLPSVESQQLLCKGTMEILELPAIPTFIS